MASRRKKPWLCAATKFSEELRAAHHVERQGFKYYMPMFINVRGKSELLFPGYLFVEQRYDWPVLNNTRGIHKIISVGNPFLVRAVEIEALRSREVNGFVRLHPQLKAGDAVRPLVGGLALLIGIVTDTLPGDRCKVLFNMLGRCSTAEFEQRMLAVA